MYQKFGYSVYRRVVGYYSSNDEEEDAMVSPLRELLIYKEYNY